jgi:hypothetical protein
MNPNCNNKIIYILLIFQIFVSIAVIIKTSPSTNQTPTITHTPTAALQDLLIYDSNTTSISAEREIYSYYIENNKHIKHGLLVKLNTVTNIFEFAEYKNNELVWISGN